jgi:hypothetical protein
MVIYITIFAVMGVLGSSVFNFSLETKNSVGKVKEVQVTAQRVMSQIADKVYNATNIISGGTTLVLAMPDGISTTTYALSSGAVTIQEGAGSAVSITPDTVYVTELSFLKFNNANPSGVATSSVQISLTVGYNEGGSAVSSTLYSVQTTAAAL